MGLLDLGFLEDLCYLVDLVDQDQLDPYYLVDLLGLGFLVDLLDLLVLVDPDL